MRIFNSAMATASITLLLVLSAVPAYALPTFQNYVVGASAGDSGGDEDTWFASGSPFTLYVVGAYGPKTASLTNVTLVLSVPDGETGTVSFSTSDEAPTLLTMTGQGTTFPNDNPASDADIHVLTDVMGDNGYSTKSFEPDNFDNHYPYKDAVSDFLLFDLGSFDNSEGPLNDYNADDGTITATSAYGEQKEYSVSFTGFSRIHLDVYGLVGTEKCTGNDINSTSKHGGLSSILNFDECETTYSWEINPGSHDSTVREDGEKVPEPGTLLLLGTGLFAVGSIRKRFAGKRSID